MYFTHVPNDQAFSRETIVPMCKEPRNDNDIWSCYLLSAYHLLL